MKNKITNRMFKSANYWSRKFGGNNTWLTEDLYQECLLSFCESELKFDPTKGLKFEGFAINCIKNHLINWLKKSNNWFNQSEEITSEFGVENFEGDLKNSKEIDFSLYFNNQLLIDLYDAIYNQCLNKKELYERFKLSKYKIQTILEYSITEELKTKLSD